MALSLTDLQDFQRFATERIGNGGSDISISVLASEWEAAREREEVIGFIREAIPDMEAGRGTPLEEVDAEIRSRLGTASKDA